MVFNIHLLKLSLITLVTLVSFKSTESLPITKVSSSNDEPERIVESKLQDLLVEANVSGVIVLYDFNQKKMYSNNFQEASIARIPASTFKIPNTLIGLEIGIIDPDSTVFVWDKQPRALKNWEQDLTIKDAFHYSCVPCYQEVARNIGVLSMNQYITQFDYGNMVVDSTSIDSFWLSGPSSISALEQIDFLVRFEMNQLGLSDKTNDSAQKIMIIEQENGYTLRGKTGLSTADGMTVGWFVGYLESEKDLVFFSTQVQPGPGLVREDFISLRVDVTRKALQLVNDLTQ